jgi:NitT/TauT family transport system substrate-binding protein
LKRLIHSFFLLCLLLVCGCSSDKKRQVNILLDWWPNPIHIPLFIGVEKGFFAEQGINLNIIKSPDVPESISYLISKRADLAVYYMPNLIKAGQRTKELQVIGVLIDQPLRAFIFREESEIDTPYDLQGKIIGANPEGFFGAYIRGAVEKWGVQFAEIKKLQFDPVAALMTRTVDVISGVFWNVEPELMRARGIPCGYFKVQEFGVPSFDELIFISRRDFLKNNPTIATRFRHAVMESIRYCKAHPDEAFAIYSSLHPDKSEDTNTWEKKCWEITYPLYPEEQNISEEKWVNFYKWLIENDLIKFDYDVRTLLRDDTTSPE